MKPKWGGRFSPRSREREEKRRKEFGFSVFKSNEDGTKGKKLAELRAVDFTEALKKAEIFFHHMKIGIIIEAGSLIIKSKGTDDFVEVDDGFVSEDSRISDDDLKV